MQRPDPSARRPARSLLQARALAATLSAALAGCDGGDPVVEPPPPAGNTAPVAAFAAPAAVAAGAPAALDAAASSDADGDALTYAWDFGDGTRGGGRQIAHAYADGGSYTIKLTVDDGRGGRTSVQRIVTVNPEATALAVVQTLAIVQAIDGTPLAGVTVATTSGSSSSGTTDAGGRATLATGTGVPVLLKFSKTGYADQFRNASLPPSADSGYLEVTMLPREPALTLPDAAVGGTLTGKDGARVTFPANALVDAAGSAVGGAVQVSMTPVDVAASVAAFPGRFAGVRIDGQQGLLLSYGPVEFVLTAGGAPVQLAPGKSATIEIPIYRSLRKNGTPLAAGDVIPLWSLDERTGAWVEEGAGTVVLADTPSGFALRATVQHFTWWNCDDFESPPAKPKPRCLVDTNADGVLEDLTGTGHCWHAGTGPEQPNNSASNARVRPLATPRALDLRTRIVPAFGALQSTPAAGGVVLPIPADMDITFRSSAMNGALFGVKVINLGPDVEQDVDIVLTPVRSNQGTVAVTLPYVDNFRVDRVGETDRFTFAAETGATYQVNVSAVAGGNLLGSVRLLGPDGAQLNGGGFGNQAFVGSATPTGSGTMTVEVVALGNTPGAYRIDVRRLANNSGCANPVALALPGTAATFSVPGNGGLRCATIELAADDVLEIANTQNLSSEGRVTLISPGGEQVGSDTYGTGSFDAMLLRAAIAQAGTWRLEISNTRSTTGSIVGLATRRLALAGTLGAPDSVAYSAASDQASSRYYVVKPAQPRDELAITLDGKGINVGARIYPNGITFGDSAVRARVIRSAPGPTHPLVDVFRRNAQTAWDFTLSSSDPTPLALDTDIAISTSAVNGGLAAVYRFTGVAGQQLTLGRHGDGNTSPGLELAAPGTGATVAATTVGRVYTLPTSGTYTLALSNSRQTGGSMSLRVNTLAAAEPVTLASTLERSATLRLGEVRRYAFNLTQGQVLAMALSTPTATDVDAVLVGGSVYQGAVSVASGPAPRSAATGARYVQQTAAAELYVYSSGNTSTSATGAYTVTVQSPAPLPTALGALLDYSAAPGVLRSFGFDIATAGAHLLCTRYDGPTTGQGQSILDARVWGPSAPFSNYGGDLNGATSGTVADVIGNLRAGANTLSAVLGLADVRPVQMRLVALPAALPLALGAAASAGTLSPCQRSYYTFSGTVGQSYTVRVTAGFTGSVRVRKLVPNGDVTARTDPPFNTGNLGGTPSALTSGAERVVTFTIPSTAPFSSGTYVIEVDGDDDGAGAFTVQAATP
jgi:PKD repeat protein